MAAANPAGANGPRQTSTTGRNRRSLANIASKGGTSYSALQRGSTSQVGALDKPKAPGLVQGQPVDPSESLKKLRELRTQRRTAMSERLVKAENVADTTQQSMTQALAARTGQAQQQAAQANMTALALAALNRNNSSGGGSIPTGPGGPVMKQLARGFAAANDPKMARFVRKNPNFMRIWLGQESGMRRGAISPPNNQGDPNYGLFQFARLDPGARPWLEKFIKGPGHGRFTANAFQQAQLAARYFDLTPRDVRTYVKQIRQGTYEGWG